MADQERSFRAPKGTNDLLPAASWQWEEAVSLAHRMFGEAGYAPCETPAFEHTEVFERGVGEGTEVVTKQMYTFEDLGGRSLTLRPEGTAPVMRAVLEHNLHRGSLPLKLYYSSWMFRQERPQKGRYRQFFQVGIEAIGSDSPALDAEVVEIGHRFISVCGVAPTVLLNTIGHPDPACRLGYLKALEDYLEEHKGELADDDRERIATNPLRTFDSKEAATIAVMRDAPSITDHVCDSCKAHFDQVQRSLSEVDVPFEAAPRLVRGLDYYTRTTFEYIAGGLGSQNAVGGGGRYDGLSELLGGPPLPGIGFALGLDRIVLAADMQPEGASRVDVYVVALGEGAQARAFQLVTNLRRAGIGADFDHAARGLKGQMKDADRSGARWAVIMGDDELASGTAKLKDLQSGEQRDVPFDELEEAVRR